MMDLDTLHAVNAAATSMNDKAGLEKISRPKLAPEQFVEVGAEPTLDEIMRRDPKTLTEAERIRLIDILRAERAQFIHEGQRKDDEDES